MKRASTLLVTSVLFLVSLGFVMLASTIIVREDPYFFVRRQALWLLISLGACFFTAKYIDYHLLRKLNPLLAIVTVILLALVFVPGIGLEVKGSSRWIRLGVLSFQPSELAKLSVVVWIAWWMSYAQRWAATFWQGFVLPLLYPGAVLILILIEPDFGSTMLVALVSGALLFLAGSRAGYLFGFASAGLGGFLFLLMQSPVRWRRVMAFMDPEQYAEREAYQLLQARNAFIAGGAFGVGLGQSGQKHHWLPEAHTDFIFAIIGEELGMPATLGVLGLFLLFFICGIIISYRAHDLFGKLLGFGITISITLQALINIGVATGSMPTKGITLPFISYGGSSLLISFIMVGILLNIAFHADDARRDRDSRLIKDQQHWV